MRRFRVFVEGKFNAIFDSIDKARECRKALQSLNFDNIEFLQERTKKLTEDVEKLIRNGSGH